MVVSTAATVFNVKEDEYVELYIPRDTIEDPNGDDLSFNLLQKDGSVLPDGLAFSNAELLLYGIASTDLLEMTLTATDTSGATVNLDVTVNRNKPPVLREDAPLTLQAQSGDAFLFEVTSDAFFSDPENDNLVLTLEIASDAQSWLSQSGL